MIGDKRLSNSNLSSQRIPSRLRDYLPDRVTVVEVGPRDGLQNQKEIVPADLKVTFIQELAETGLKVVEATSFVNPKWVPQLADAEEVMSKLARKTGVRYPVLVPNEKGLDRAVESGADEVAIFASATETFSQKNLNHSRDEAIEMFRPVVKRAKEDGLQVRGYLSMVLGDPWEGEVPLPNVVDAARRVMDLGCDELSLGDTIGVGTPGRVQELISALIQETFDVSKIAVHFHDTYGQGLVNVLAALQLGVTIVDSSAGGLGGCPFAKSATGNLATEELIWMLDGLGVETGVDVHAVADVSRRFCKKAGIPIPGRVARALESE